MARTKTRKEKSVEDIEKEKEEREEKSEENVEEEKTKRRLPRPRGKGGTKRKREKRKIILTSARRKMAIARARIKEGKGIVRINKVKLEAIENPYIREIISEPLRLAGDYPKQLSIEVNTSGGGPMGQAQAARTAIARGIVEFTGDEELKKAFIDYDRFLLVEDIRMVEPKKFKGRKARARFQKSYR